MPVAIHIAAPEAHASMGKVGASGKANNSGVDLNSAAAIDPGIAGQSFGALFRAQAGTGAEELASGKTAGTDTKAGANSDAAEAKLNAKGSLDAEGASSANAQLEAGEPDAEAHTGEASGAKSTIATNSSQALLDAQLKSQFLAGAGDAAGEASDVIAQSDSGASLSGKAEGKKTSGSASAASAPSLEKTKRESVNADGKQEVAAVVAAPIPVIAAPAPAPMIAVPAAPVPSGLKDAGSAKGNLKPATLSAQSLSPTLDAGKEDAAEVSAENIQAAASGHDATLGVTPLKQQEAPAQSAAIAADKTPADSGKAVEAAATAQHASAAAHVPASAVTGGATAQSASAAAPVVVHGGDAAPTVSHVVTPVQAAVSGATGASGASPAVAGSAYDKIDQGTAPVVLHSGTQHVSVGVQDPNLGWVEIKTQNLGGHVDATLVTASGQSHDTLAAQLPAMAQFLEQRDVRVGALAVHHEAPTAQSGFTGNMAGSGGGSNYGGGSAYSGHSGSGAGSNSGAENRASYSSLSSLSRAAPVPVSTSDEAALRPMSYISVRA